MLTLVAEDVLVHQSELLRNNTVVVQGRAGVLVVDPGIRGAEMACLAEDLRELGQPVVAGFSTHPDWDHVLWHPGLGAAPRHGTARCAASMRELLSDPDWKVRAASRSSSPATGPSVEPTRYGDGSPSIARTCTPCGDGRAPDDPRIGPAATFGTDWLPGVADWQLQQLARRSDHDGARA